MLHGQPQGRGVRGGGGGVVNTPYNDLYGVRLRVKGIHFSSFRLHQLTYIKMYRNLSFRFVRNTQTANSPFYGFASFSEKVETTFWY